MAQKCEVIREKGNRVSGLEKLQEKIQAFLLKGRRVNSLSIMALPLEGEMVSYQALLIYEEAEK